MNISRNRQGFALPEYIAYANIARVLRAYERAERYAVAIVIPRWEDKGVYLRAAAAHLNPTNDFRVPDRAYAGDEKRDTYDTILDDFANKRTIVLFADVRDVPDEIAIAFDSVLRLEVPSDRLVRGVVKWVHKVDITLEEAGTLGRSNWRWLKLAVVRGRPISRVLKKLRDLEEAQPRASQRNPIIDAALKLESMEGYGEAKLWGLDLARDIAEWQSARLAWDDVDKGVLLSGPPGVGKTIFSQALAATCGMDLVIASYATWQAKGHLGDFLKAMRASFAEAKMRAPAILFIDELDAFGDRDTLDSDNSSYDIKAINGLLEQLDGLEAREGVVVVGACNYPDRIDPAILRPGRLDRHIRIPLPDPDARAAIFRMHLRQELSTNDHRALAEATDGLAGAAIQQIVRDARRSARRRRTSLTVDDVFRYVPPVVVLPKDVVRLNAIHEIGHAVVGAVLGMELSKVSVVSSLRLGQSKQHVGQAVFARRVWERRTKQHYLDIIAMTMAGMAAEQLLLGCWDDGSTGGAGSDLHEATKLAIALERSCGMGKNLASYGPVNDGGADDLRNADATLMAEVDSTLRAQLERSTGIIERNRSICLKLVSELTERGELMGREVSDALNEPGCSDAFHTA
ncbi:MULTISPECIES: AAA family ATPase [unclassified Rhizobium]|uniref:AAA family ATPase n=1 Tax=unclassified Rhizobium TaxID=2613769 RepID=UPI001AD986A0|nr:MULTISPECIES: AAA family ATPase [unclassified Rhizobium]MBO9124963.1 AAA family ATPase [Rhizobium sp. 16-488-2b]MBO9175548.1 AAA family ATPase [Rhizobium sp. 16-488-2a]